MQADNKKSIRRITFYLASLAIAMFGFAFALVPLYNVLCKVTGLNGKTSNMAASETSGKIDYSRTITVQFLATNNEELPWEFYPRVKTIRVHPGEKTRITYYAKNISPNTMTVQAIPSIAPELAALHLKKTECFCFTQQTFHSGEAREMPVLFYIDPDLPKNIEVLSLSYTMFDAGKFKQKTSDVGHP